MVSLGVIERTETQVTFRTGHMGYTFRFWEREMWMLRKASSMMEERLRFVARLLHRETTTDVCREFGVTQPLVVGKSLADLFQNLMRERDAFGFVS
jgi:hypothetical protein